MAKKKFMDVKTWHESYAPTVISNINKLKNQFTRDEMEFLAFESMEMHIQKKSERINGKSMISVDAATSLMGVLSTMAGSSPYTSAWNANLPWVMKYAGDLFRDYDTIIKYSGKSYEFKNGYCEINIK